MRDLSLVSLIECDLELNQINLQTKKKHNQQ